MTTSKENTVLSVACMKGHNAVVGLLLAYGADATKKVSQKYCFKISIHLFDIYLTWQVK